jgi:hypothetical protein
MPTPVHASFIPFILEELQLIGHICPTRPIKVNVNFRDGGVKVVTTDSGQCKMAGCSFEGVEPLHTVAILFVNMNFIF